MRWAAGVGVVVLLVALAPSVVAGHTMGHRYLVYGRIVDSNGMPLQNQEVTIKIKSDATSMASIVATTDCLGDFDSWKGQPGNDPPGGGVGREPGLDRQPTHDPPYITFHFHDPDLSDRYKVELTVGGDTWTESFHSKTRQTAVSHQVGFAGSAACGDYAQFNRTFTVRVAMLASDEWTYTTEQTPRERTVEASLAGSTINGTTDFNGAFTGTFDNVSLAQGETLTVTSPSLGTKKFNVDADAAKFRRVNGAYRVSDGGGGGSLDDLRNFGIFVVIVGLVVGLWWGGKKVQARMSEKRLRETSTRRRFRRQNQP